jgi:hypothetical protein
VTLRERVAVTAACVGVFLGSWTLLHQAWYRSSGELVDTPEYQAYAHRMVDGEVPYRDFGVEYPPGALLPMLAPDATAVPGDFGSYGHTFEKWMAGAGVAMVLLAAAGLATLRAPPVRFTAALLLVAVSPLLLGNVMLSRFDLWASALTVGAVAALAARRDRLGGAVLGAAIATKLFPAVIVPLGLAWVWQRRGRRAALGWLALVAAVVVAAYLPFAVLSPAGVYHSFGLQARRPLQIESLGSTLILAVHSLTGYAVSLETSYGSQNLASGASGALAAVTTAAQVLALVAVWVGFARRPASAARFVAAAAATVALFIGLGKVFSPQYMIWLVPLVPLVRSRIASLLLAAGLVLTQVEFPGHYWRLTDFAPWTTWVVLARDLVVVALAAALVRAALERAPSLGGHRARLEALRAIGAQPE